MTRAASVMKTFGTGIFVGAFLALFITILGVFVIFLYGVSHAPQDIHLSLFSQPIFDFSSTPSQLFQMGMHMQGMLYVITALMLLGAVLFWLFQGIFRSSKSQKPQ